MTDSAENVVEVRGLRTAFGSHVVHEHLDLTLRRGEILGVIGGSGTGKSVLLRVITGLKRAASGSVRLFGVETSTLDPGARRSLDQRTGLLFQDGALFSSLSVRENVEVPLHEYTDLTPELRETVARLKVRLVGLPWDAADRFPRELSGGMRKRAGLARALALEPEVLFLDEPTAGLDPIGAAAFDELVRTLSRALGITVFMVTHDLDSLYAIADRVAVLADQRVLLADRLEVVEQIDHPWVRAYFHGPRARAARAAGSATA